MVSVAARGLKIGTIIDKTLAMIEHNTVAALLYLAAFSAINAAVTYFALTMTAPLKVLAITLLSFLVGVVGAYLLLDAMLAKTGLRTRGNAEAFYPYLGLSILYGLGVGIGLIALVLPGIVFMARWSIAQPLIVARGGGVMRAFGESWDQTRGNEFPIIFAALAMVVPLAGVVIACRVLFEQTDLVGIAVSQLASSGINVILLAMFVALYGLIVGAPAAGMKR